MLSQLAIRLLIVDYGEYGLPNSVNTVLDAIGYYRDIRYTQMVNGLSEWLENNQGRGNTPIALLLIVNSYNNIKT